MTEDYNNSSPNHLSAAAPLDLERLTRHLSTSAIGHTVHYHTSIPSTMPVARTLAQAEQTRSGTLVVAEEQTAGRGRFDRRWLAPPAQALLVSVILKQPHLHLPPTHLSMAAALATLRAIAAMLPLVSSSLYLKWPNDLLLGQTLHSAGKVAGLLAEAAFIQSRLAYVILGIGINVNQDHAALPEPESGIISPPTSLRIFTGHNHDRTTLLIHLCQQLAHVLTQPAVQIFQDWRAHLSTLGQSVTVHRQDGRLIHGQAADVNEQGELVVVDDRGKHHIFAAGDVSLRTKFDDLQR